MKKYGGVVEIVYLSDVGVKGISHFLMADLNRIAVADIMEKWIESK